MTARDVVVPCGKASYKAPNICYWNMDKRTVPRGFDTHLCMLDEYHEGLHRCQCGEKFSESAPEPPTIFLRVTI